MNQFRRLFFDISYTRTQRGNIGITRTVRRLMEELENLGQSGSFSFTPIAFHETGFRQIQNSACATFQTDDSATKESILFRFAYSKIGRRFLLPILHLPWFLVQPLWHVASAKTFNALTSSLPPVEFEPGDVLLLCDASWNYEVWKAAKSAQKKGALIVLVVLDLIPIKHPHLYFPLLPLVFKEWILQMLQCSDAVVCISQATEDDLRIYLDKLQLTIPSLGHFHLGCDFPASTFLAPPSDRVHSFIANSQSCFAAVGSFEPKKNYHRLVRIFENLWHQGENVHLIIAGRPTPECTELIKLLKVHPEQGNRLITVFDATDSDIALIYSKCNALIFLSMAEGFGLPLVEARVRGCPVIANDLPVFRELADNGVSICREDSEVELESLILEHAKTNRRLSIPPMPLFTWSDSARQCLNVMNNLLKLKRNL